MSKVKQYKKGRVRYRLYFKQNPNTEHVIYARSANAARYVAKCMYGTEPYDIRGPQGPVFLSELEHIVEKELAELTPLNIGAI